MATVSSDFTATGNGNQLYVRHGEKFDYAVAGTFVGTVVLEKSRDGGLNFEAITSATGSATGTVLVETPDRSGSIVRFRCSAFTSGTIETDLTDVSEVAQSFLDQDGSAAL